MRWIAGVVLTLAAVAGFGQEASADPFKALSFLEGNWEAKTSGSGEVKAIGTYAFQKDLGGHVLARRDTSKTECLGPKGFDCEHKDLLYVYPEGDALKAIYFDNEGHVLHYGVTTPTASSVQFLSEGPGPVFRLSYELKDGVMTGRFEMKMPGAAEWRPYLVWSGGRVGK